MTLVASLWPAAMSAVELALSATMDLADTGLTEPTQAVAETLSWIKWLREPAG